MATDIPPEAGEDIMPALKEGAEIKLSDFFGNANLSDIKIQNPDTLASKAVHKAILASGSQYFLSLFMKMEANTVYRENFDKGAIDVPKPVKTAQNPSGACSDEIINLILKYIYNNQDFKVIKEALNDQNIIQLYSQAYMMKCPNLIKDIEGMVVNELVNPGNATVFYLDAIQF